MSNEYLGVDTREYRDATEQDDQVVLAFSHEHYGRLRFPLDVSEVEQVRDDIDSALVRLANDTPDWRDHSRGVVTDNWADAGDNPFLRVAEMFDQLEGAWSRVDILDALTDARKQMEVANE